MVLSKDFKPLNEYYNDEDKPISQDGAIGQFPENLGGNIMMPDSALNIPIPPKTEKTSFGRTMELAFSSVNEAMQAGRFIARQMAQLNPLNDDVPDDFDPFDIRHLEGLPPKYWNYLADAKSPNDLEARKNFILEEISLANEMQNGSGWAMLIGGLAGGILSPSSWVPIASTAKYATLSQGLLKNMMKVAPSVGVSALAHNAYMQSTDMGGNLEDLVIDTMRDSVYGMAFMGAGLGLGTLYRGAKVWNIRKMTNMSAENLDVKPVLKSNGELDTSLNEYGLQVVPVDGASVSAAKTEQYQEFLNNAISKKGFFAIPAISKIAGNTILGSNEVFGLSNRFGAIQTLTDRLSAHSFITEGIERGEAKAKSAETILSQFNAGNADFSLQFRSHFYEENGIVGGANFTNAIRALKQRVQKGLSMSWEEFNNKVISAVIEQDFSYSKSINAAAKLLEEHFENVYVQALESRGLSTEILPPRNALGYYMQNYNWQAVNKRPQEFIQMVADELAAQDVRINQILGPLKEAEAKLEGLKKQKLSGEGDQKKLFAEIQRVRRQVRKEKKAIERLARSGNSESESVGILLEDRNFLTVDEAKELQEIFTPLKMVQTEVSNSKKKRTGITRKIQKSKDAMLKAKTKKTADKHKKNRELFEKELEEVEKELAALEGKLRDTQFEIDELAFNGKAPSNFFHLDGNVVHWRDPSEWARFRKPFENNQARVNAATQLRNTILHLSHEETQQQILHNLMPGYYASPMKRRTVMVPAKTLLDNGFILSDAPFVSSAYSRSMGRNIALNTVFKDINTMEGEDGMLGITRLLSEERAAQEQNILKIKDKDKQAKELEKLAKDFDKAKNFAKNMYDQFMGRSPYSTGSRRAAAFARNYAVVTKLMAVPISQMTDLGAIAFRNGVWPSVRDGVIPVIKTMNGYLKGKASELFRRNAGDTLLALQHESTMSNQKITGGYGSDAPPGILLESAMQDMAQLSGNLSMMNSVENMTQRMTANVVQSRFIRHMYEYTKGTLKKSDLEQLLIWGLDPKKWAKKIIASYEKTGGKYTKYKGMQSRYWEWQDDTASAIFSDTIYRATYDTIVQRGLFTSPFWTNSPWPSIFTLFKGWGFAAFARYTAPMMQRIDANKIQGAALMLMIGALTDKVRDVANGNRADTKDTDTWFAKSFEAISNSGLLGHTTDMLETTNVLMNGNLLPKMTTKYKGWNKFSTLGPVAGIGEDYVKLLEVLKTGKVTEREAKRLARLVPFEGALYWRALINKYIESFELPKTRRELKK